MTKVSYVCWLRIFKCSFLPVVRRNCCFRGRKKSHRQGILRKGMFAWLTHLVAFDGCWWIWVSDSILSIGHTGESVLALQVKLWKRGRVFEDEVFIDNTCLGVGSKNAGRNSNEDVVLNTDHVVFLANDFPRLIVYVRPPSLFSGTRGIPPILNYRSVSPITPWSFWDYTLREDSFNMRSLLMSLSNQYDSCFLYIFLI